MKQKIKLIFVVLIVAAIAGGLIVAYLAMRGEREKEKQREKPVSAESRVKRMENGEVALTFDAETQKRIGLQVTPLIATNLSREIKVYGRVLDPGSLVAQVSEVASAQVGAKTSQEELERLRKLRENTSVRALQAAEANARRDELAAQSAQNKLRLEWGSAIAERGDLSNLVQSLASFKDLLVRLDLPAGEILPAQPTGARIIPLGAKVALAAEFLSVAPNVDAQNQAQGFIFLAKQEAVGLAPGTSVNGFVVIPGERLGGVVMPRSAVVRYLGKAWVYLQLDDKTFARREVVLEIPLADGWFISQGLTDKDRIVVDGAETLLSEELKSQITQPD